MFCPNEFRQVTRSHIYHPKWEDIDCLPLDQHNQGSNFAAFQLVEKIFSKMIFQDQFLKAPPPQTQWKRNLNIFNVWFHSVLLISFQKWYFYTIFKCIKQNTKKNPEYEFFFFFKNIILGAMNIAKIHEHIIFISIEQ